MTRKKAEANRKNALRSTGPKTDAGKKNSAQNSFTHGLTANFMNFPDGEEQAECQMFREAYIRDFAPRTSPEKRIMENLAFIEWQRRKAAVSLSEYFDNTRSLTPRLARYLGDAGLLDIPAPFGGSDSSFAAIECQSLILTTTKSHEESNADLEKGIEAEGGTSSTNHNENNDRTSVHVQMRSSFEVYMRYLATLDKKFAHGLDELERIRKLLKDEGELEEDESEDEVA